MARNPVGAGVYVDPDHPRQAVLEKEVAGEAKQYAKPFLVGAIITLVGLGHWFLAPHLAAPRPSHVKQGYNVNHWIRDAVRTQSKVLRLDPSNREFRKQMEMYRKATGRSQRDTEKPSLPVSFRA